MSKVTANDSGASRSIWMKTAVDVFENGLSGDARAEVCVIGAGIAGLSVAYELAARGLDVIVVDDGPTGGGETARTTAHLASALDDRFTTLESLHGRLGARFAAESHQKAIDRIEEIATREGIECHFRRVDGYLFGGPGSSAQSLSEEAAHAVRAGLTDTTILEDFDFLGFHTGRVIRFPRQAQMDPIRYLAGLARAVVGRGARVVSGVHVERITGDENAAAVTFDGKRIEARAFVSATNAAFLGGPEMSLKQAAYRSYAIGIRAPRTATPILLWDDLDPYHYVRLADGDEGENILIVGGEDHRTGLEHDAEERYRALESWSRERFQGLGEIVARWSGQVLEPIDGLAFIGRVGEGRYVVTGDSGHGITHGAIGGMLVADLIEGKQNPWAELYDPKRRTLRAAKEFIRENATTAAQYADWFEGGDAAGPEQVAPASGAVLRRGLHLVALYRAPDGVCHEHSAVCPHLGGIVNWNAAESSWDCPCHGSRFDPLGRVVSGPATSDLTPTSARGPEPAT